MGSVREAWERLQATFWVALPAIELFGGLTGVVLGGWFLTHPGLFSKYEGFFAPMRLVGAPPFWGAGILALGLHQLHATLAGDLWRRQFGCLLAFAGWLGLLVFWCLGDTAAPGIPLFAIQALQAFVAYLLLASRPRRGDGGPTE